MRSSQVAARSSRRRPPQWRITLFHAVAMIAVLISADPSCAEPMAYRWISPCEEIGRFCDRRILALGDIEPDSADKLKAFLDQPQIRDGSRDRAGIELCFDSP